MSEQRKRKRSESPPRNSDQTGNKIAEASRARPSRQRKTVNYAEMELQESPLRQPTAFNRFTKSLSRTSSTVSAAAESSQTASQGAQKRPGEPSEETDLPTNQDPANSAYMLDRLGSVKAPLTEQAYEEFMRMRPLNHCEFPSVKEWSEWQTNEAMVDEACDDEVDAQTEVSIEECRTMREMFADEGLLDVMSREETDWLVATAKQDIIANRRTRSGPDVDDMRLREILTGETFAVMSEAGDSETVEPEQPDEGIYWDVDGQHPVAPGGNVDWRKMPLLMAARAVHFLEEGFINQHKIKIKPAIKVPFSQCRIHGLDQKTNYAQVRVHPRVAVCQVSQLVALVRYRDEPETLKENEDDAQKNPISHRCSRTRCINYTCHQIESSGDNEGRKACARKPLYLFGQDYQREMWFSQLPWSCPHTGKCPAKSGVGTFKWLTSEADVSRAKRVLGID